MSTSSAGEVHPLERCMNFRDLGGVLAREGWVVRGRLFRTAHLSEVDDVAAAHLCEVLQIGTYVDFRTEAEVVRDGDPAPLLARGVRWVRHPFDIADPTFDALKLPQPADWEALYFRAVQRLAPEFAGALEVIAAATTPVVFGCWVGKDRTGMVAALLLSLLGVDEQTIASEYAKTTALLTPFRERFAVLWQDEPETAAEIFEAYGTAAPEVMAGFLERVKERFGSVERALNLNPALVETLRARYLTAGA
jgi:protein-tyrosine phosphatase